jgi:glycosyltransferase involved in cell wall biosynthesis
MNNRSAREIPERKIHVLMLDLLSIVPYYDAYLCHALQRQPVSVTLAAITYYLDPDCFNRLGVLNRPGLLDITGKFRLPRLIRIVLKGLEMAINVVALAVRIVFAPPEVIHIQYLPLLAWRIPCELWFLRFCRRFGCSLVCTVHDILPSDTGERHFAIFDGLYHMMDAIICHSEAIRSRLVSEFKIAPSRIAVIPHGPFFYDLPGPSDLTIREKLDLQDGECLVLFQGIIRPYKGVDFLLDAWRKVQDSGTKAKLVIAGTGDPSLLSAIAEKVSSLSLDGSVELCFRYLPSEEMLAYYQACDIVVYPYQSVTTSGALMTGITRGKAIVATLLPPFQEILEHGKTALLCDYLDAAQLAASLLTLIADPVLRRRLGDNAASLRLGEEAWNRIAEQTSHCYGTLRASESGAHPGP